MSGLDKMKSQILDEAAHTAEEKIAEAEAKAEKYKGCPRRGGIAGRENLRQGSGGCGALRTAYRFLLRDAADAGDLRAKQEVIADVLDNGY